jgi:hypothetical protein
LCCVRRHEMTMFLTTHAYNDASFSIISRASCKSNQE